MKKPKIFYGYWILGVSFLFCVITVGCGGGTFSLFVTTLQAAKGWNRTEIMLATTIYIFISGITSPFVGRWIERYGVRKVIPTGAFVSGIGFFLLSQMSLLSHYYIGYAVMGIGMTASGPLTLSYVVSHWFHRRRGMAVGIMSVGIGMSGIAFAPLTAIYLIPHLGWSHAYLALGAINCGIIIPLSIWIVRSKPSEMGLQPDGVEVTESIHIEKKKLPPYQGISLKSALKTSAFWLIGVSLIFNHTHLGLLQNVFPHLMDAGFSLGTAATAVSVSSIFTSLGMFFFGWLCDKIAPKYAAAIGLGFLGMGILIFIHIGRGSSMELIYLYVVVMGLGVGSWMPTMSMLTSTTFGLASYGAIFGVMSLFQNFGGGTGPLIAGYFYDSMHTYRLGFTLILAMVCLAIPLVLSVRRPAHHQ